MRESAHCINQIPIQDWSILSLFPVWVYDGEAHPTGRDFVSEGPAAKGKDFGTWLIRKGSVKVTSNGETLVAGRGQWMFPALGERHQVFSEGARLLSVCFHASWPDGEHLFGLERSLVLDARKFPRLEATAIPMEKLIRKHFPQRDLHLAPERATLRIFLQLQHLFMDWMIEYTGAMAKLGMPPNRLGPTDPRLMQAVFTLDRQPLQAPMDEVNIARKIGLSAGQLHRLFKERFGFTPHRYFEERRVDYARRCLRGSAASIKEIASQLGFKNLSHFSAWFARTEGTSPRQFRKRR